MSEQFKSATAFELLTPAPRCKDASQQERNYACSPSFSSTHARADLQAARRKAQGDQTYNSRKDGTIPVQRRAFVNPNGIIREWILSHNILKFPDMNKRNQTPRSALTPRPPHHSSFISIGAWGDCFSATSCHVRWSSAFDFVHIGAAIDGSTNATVPLANTLPRAIYAYKVNGNWESNKMHRRFRFPVSATSFCATTSFLPHKLTKPKRKDRLGGMKWQS